MKKHLSLYELLTIIFKHRYKVLITFFVTIIVAGIIIKLENPMFEANATLLVKFGREYIYNDVMNGTKPSSGYMNKDAIINNEIEILTSNNLIKDVITSYGLKNLYENIFKSDIEIDKISRSILEFKDHLLVRGVAESDLIRISFKHENPKVASDITNILIDLYKIHHINAFRNPNTVSFLKNKVSIYKNYLSSAEEKIRDFKKNNATYAFDQQILLLLQQKSELESDLKKSENDRLSFRDRLFFLNNQKKKVEKNIEISREVNKFTPKDKDILLNLQVKKQNLLKKYKLNHPLVESVNREINTVNKFLNKNENSSRIIVGKNIIYQEIEREMLKTEADLKSKDSSAKEINRQIQDIDQSLTRMTEQEKELQNLQRETKKYANDYQSVLSKLEQAQVAEEMDHQRMTNISIVQSSTPPAVPVGAQKTLKLFISLLFGGLAGIGVAFFAEELTQGLSTPAGVEKRLGLPLLTSITHKPLNPNRTPSSHIVSPVPTIPN